jgi:hypothetical protein
MRKRGKRDRAETVTARPCPNADEQSIAEATGAASGPRRTIVDMLGSGLKPSFSFSRRIGSFSCWLSVSSRAYPRPFAAAICARLRAVATPRPRHGRATAVNP